MSPPWIVTFRTIINIIKGVKNMSNISAAMVKELREKTGAGMMDCKKALAETDGNMEEAFDWLRKKGLSAAAKKSGRTAAEGLVGVKVDGNRGVVVEVNSETDFVSKNDKFQDFVENVTSIMFDKCVDVNALKDVPYMDSGKSVSDALTELIAVIGENMNLRRCASLEVENGVVAQYVHNKTKDGMGRIAVLVALESDSDNKEKLMEYAKKIAMHIAAANPAAMTIEDLDQDVVAKEKALFEDQVKDSGKPAEIIEKMLTGRMQKFFKEVVLMEQTFLIDTDYTVKSYLEAAAKELGTDVKLKGYVRFEIGEGVDVEEKDFASEVAEQLAK